MWPGAKHPGKQILAKGNGGCPRLGTQKFKLQCRHARFPCINLKGKKRYKTIFYAWDIFL
jgi:hypothetical protein